MSRRKQGRPQQRKSQCPLEEENDLLVCGDCQTRFPLHDIVHFIRHKKQCCNKENVLSSDTAPSRPDGGDDSSHVLGDKKDDGVEDMVDEGVDMSKVSSRREEDEEAAMDNDSENEEDSMDAVEHTNLENGEVMNGEVKEGRSGQTEKSFSSHAGPSSRQGRTPLRQRQVVDAESNTTHSEPSRFVCETCRSTYTSAWALLQHAQKEHGMKIYTSPSATSSHYQQSSSASTPITSAMSPIDLIVASSSPRSGIDHRSVSSGSNGSSSPYPIHVPNPFASPFRLPLDSRLSHPTSLSPFSRPTSFDFDLVNDYRLRPQLIARGASGLEHSSFSLERARAHISPVLDSQYDFYSMRLKQLASSPVVPQSKSQFSASSQPQPANVAVTPSSSKAESPPAEASLTLSPRGSSLPAALILPPKQKACEFCGKTFRFLSNLVVHRRSHTGEKPYKCPHCPHACTQQSKLKRHMKTHANKTGEEEEEEEEISSATSNHKRGVEVNDVDDDDDDDDDDEDEEEEEEEEEEEGEEDEEEDAMAEEDFDEQEAIEKGKEANKCSPQLREPGEISPEAKKIKLEVTTDNKPVECIFPRDLTLKPKPTESLLSEVMKRTGLNDIQTYSEAYKAALAESQEKSRRHSGDTEDARRGDTDSPESFSSKVSRLGVKRELDSGKESVKVGQKGRIYSVASGLQSKLVKQEPSSTSVWPSTIEAATANNIDPAAASAYPRILPSWLTSDSPIRLFFPSYPPRFPGSHDLSLNPENHNGLNLSPTVPTSSALKGESQSTTSLLKPRLTSPPAYPSHFLGTSSTSNSPTSNLLLPTNGSSVSAPPRKEHRRNDTCEYCGKVFKNCSNLTVHRRSHTGEKPYRCNLCSYACAQSSKLTRHMKTHGRFGKDVFTCKFCNMPFSVPSTLEKHMRKCVGNCHAGLVENCDAGVADNSNAEIAENSNAGVAENSNAGVAENSNAGLSAIDHGDVSLESNS